MNGIIELASADLFRKIQTVSIMIIYQENNIKYTLKMNYIEIYKEKLRDLVNQKYDPKIYVNEYGVHLDASEHIITNIEEIKSVNS